MSLSKIPDSSAKGTGASGSSGWMPASLADFQVEGMEAAALTYWKMGWHLVPLKPRSKVPIVMDWPERAPRSEDAVRGAFSSSRNLGVALGERSGGLIDIDVDCIEAVRVAYEVLPPPFLIYQRTDAPSIHFLYHVEGELPPTEKFQDPTRKKDPMLVEVRSTGAQTMLPPSVHPDGGDLRWLHYDPDATIDAGVLVRSVKRLAAITLLGRIWVSGFRHEPSLPLAGGLLRAGWDQGQVDDLVRLICRASGDDDLKDRLNAVRTTERAIAAGDKVTGWPRLVQLIGKGVVDKVIEWLGVEGISQIEMFGDDLLSDVGNASRFESRYGEDTRYCAAFGKWLIWGGTYWEIDETEHIVELGKQLTREMAHDAADLADPDAQRKFFNHALKSQQEPRIQALLTLARASRQIAIRPIELDSDLNLFAVANGTIDLRTGELRPPRREDLITRASPVVYTTTPLAEAVRLWNMFLWQATKGNEELIRFLQMAVGYTLLGGNPKELFFFIHGDGGAGKSTFLEAVKAAFGPYAKTANFESFLEKRNVGGPSGDIARLQGARLVVSIEVGEGKKMAEALLQTLTGRDTITVRYMYKEEFEYLPAFTLWLSANDPPKLRAENDAIWRRILRIPFNNPLPESKRDPTVKDRLKDPTFGGPAVLAWVLEGAAMVRDAKEGLIIPDVVRQETERYREESDSDFGPFFEDCIVEAEGASIEAGELYSLYSGWAKMRGIHPESPQRFGRYAKAFVNGRKERRGRKDYYTGITRKQGLPIVMLDKGAMN